MRPIRREERRVFELFRDGVDAARQARLRAHGVDTGVGAATLRQLLNRRIDAAFPPEIERDRAGLARHLESFGNGVDCNDALGAEQERAADRHLSHGPAAPGGDGIALLNVAEFGGHVAGREDVREEDHLVVGKTLGDLDWTHIGIRHAQVLGLAATVTAENMCVAEQPGGRMSPELFCGLPVRIGALAGGKITSLAEEALAAGDGEWHDNAIADLELLVFLPNLDDLANGLMAKHVAALHLRHDAVVDVQVGAADRAGRDLDDRVAAVLDFGVGNAFAADVALAMPGQSSHFKAPVAWPPARRSIGRVCGPDVTTIGTKPSLADRLQPPSQKGGPSDAATLSPQFPRGLPATRPFSPPRRCAAPPPLRDGSGSP